MRVGSNKITCLYQHINYSYNPDWFEQIGYRVALIKEINGITNCWLLLDHSNN